MDSDDYLDGLVMKHVVTEIMALSTLTQGDDDDDDADDDDGYEIGNYGS